MCLAVISTAHPHYAFVLISNRDEFLGRKARRADWWEAPNQHILGGRDLQHASQGTWLGITKQGRLALLTNFREAAKSVAGSTRSRGELPKMYLQVPRDSGETAAGFAARLFREEDVQHMDGFSLMFGRVASREPLGIVSNRTASASDTVWVAGAEMQTFGQTCALSNSRFGDPWPKVVRAEELLARAIEENVARGGSQADFLDACFAVLGDDSLPPKKAGEDWLAYSFQLRNTVFVPPIITDERFAGETPEAAMKAGSSVYGTSQQTVILVDHAGNVTFVEKSLWDERAAPRSGQDQQRRFDFTIESP